jgi:hypothetical protein
MKPNKILLILMTALLVVSCKKDDDGNDEFVLNNENLSGTYELVFYETTSIETTNVNGLDVVSIINNIGDTFEVDYTFTPDGKYSASGLFRIVLTIMVNGELTSEDAFIETVDIANGNFSTTSSSSILVMDGITYEVSVFNENEFRIMYNEIRTFPNGDTEDYTEELHFIRK